MSSSNTPCNKPELCGVKSHRPGTQAACMISGPKSWGSSSLQATPVTPAFHQPFDAEAELINEVIPSLELDHEVNEIATSIVNDGPDFDIDERERLEEEMLKRFRELGVVHEEDQITALRKVIQDKEHSMNFRSKADSTEEFGSEHVTPSALGDHLALRISAGDRSGYLASYSGVDGGYIDGDLILVPDEHLDRLDGNFTMVGAGIHKTWDGELWIASSEIPGHAWETPIKLSDLKEGDRNSNQEKYPASQDREYSVYELARRLYANPVTRRYMETHAKIENPRIDNRYQNRGDSPFYLAPNPRGSKEARIKEVKPNGKPETEDNYPAYWHRAGD